jgi:hypothetical protein
MSDLRGCIFARNLAYARQESNEPQNYREKPQSARNAAQKAAHFPTDTNFSHRRLAYSTRPDKGCHLGYDPRG